MKTTLNQILLCKAVLIALSIGGLSAQTSYFIDQNSTCTTGCDGSSWSTAFTTVCEGLDAIAAGDTLHVAEGSYLPCDSAGQVPSVMDWAYFGVGDVVMLGGYPSGGGARDWVDHPTTLSGDQNQNGVPDAGDAHTVVLTIDDGAVLDGVIVEGGFADNADAAPIPGRAGAGVYNQSYVLSISNSIIRYNHAYGNGSDNGVGGGLISFGTADVTNCLFKGNEASANGGAISGESASMEIFHCTIDSNSANKGGGIHFFNADVDVYNSILSNNTGTNGNFNDDSQGFGGVGTAYFTLFDDVFPPGIVDGGGLITGAGVSPQYQLGSSLRKLHRCSPAIDMGSVTYAQTSEDYFGELRDMFGAPDMGFFELQSHIVYVDSSAAAGGDGSSWATAFRYLHDGLDEECTGPTDKFVYVAKGTYYPDEGAGRTNNNRSHNFELRHRTKVYGGFPSGGGSWSDRDWRLHPTIADGDIQQSGSPSDYTHRIFVIPLNNDFILIDGLIVQHGSNYGGTSEGGGLVLNNGSSATLVNCIFRSNGAVRGGAIYMRSSTSGTTLTCTNSLFYDNFANDGGGALYIYTAGTASPYNSSIAATFINSTFVENSSSDRGGVFKFRAANSADSIDNRLTLRNCVAWDNSGQYNTDVFDLDVGTQARFSHSMVHGVIPSNAVDLGSNLFDVDPQFVSASVDSFQLKAISPALGAGSNAYNTTQYDLSKLGRLRNASNTATSVIDMGAYEYQICGNLISNIHSTSAKFDSAWVSWNANSDALSYDIGLVDTTLGEVFDSMPAISNIPDTNIVLANLESGHVYAVYVRLNCDLGPGTWMDPLFVQTLTCIDTFPWQDNLSDYDVCTSNHCGAKGGWRESIQDEGSWNIVSNSFGPPDFWYPKRTFLADHGFSGSSVLYTPFFNLDSICEPEFFFAYDFDYIVTLPSGSPITLSLDISTDEGANWIPLWDTTGYSTDGWQYKKFDLSNYSGKVVLQLEATVGTVNVYLDGFALDSKPFEAVIDTVMDHSIVIEWMDVPGASYYEIEVVDVQNGDTMTGIPTYTSIADTFYTIDGLDSFHTYSVFTRYVCPIGPSDWIAFDSITTTGCFTAPWLDDMEGYTSCQTSTPILGPWAQVNLDMYIGDGEPWNVYGDSLTCSSLPGLQNTDFPLHDRTVGGTNYFFFSSEYMSPEPSRRLRSPCVDISTLTDPELTFYYYQTYGAMAYLRISDDEGDTWETVWIRSESPEQVGHDGLWKGVSIDLKPYGERIQLEFLVTPYFQQSLFAIDDVSIDEAAPCPMVSHLRNTTISSSSTRIDWSVNSMHDEYEIEIVDAFENRTGIADFTGIMDTSHLLTGLLPDTTYRVYVRGLCGADTAIWSEALVFRQGCDFREGLNLASPKEIHMFPYEDVDSVDWQHCDSSNILEIFYRVHTSMGTDSLRISTCYPETEYQFPPILTNYDIFDLEEVLPYVQQTCDSSGITTHTMTYAVSENQRYHLLFTGFLSTGQFKVTIEEIKNCPETSQVSAVVNGGEYRASGLLTTDAAVPQPYQVLFSGEGGVLMNPGFEVELGAEVEVDTDGCE